jgi:hypothetical protein
MATPLLGGPHAAAFGPRPAKAAMYSPLSRIATPHAVQHAHSGQAGRACRRVPGETPYPPGYDGRATTRTRASAPSA